jgi:hypothetical protein
MPSQRQGLAVVRRHLPGHGYRVSRDPASPQKARRRVAQLALGRGLQYAQPQHLQSTAEQNATCLH